MKIRKVTKKDIEEIKTILADWISDKNEIEERIDEITQSPNDYFLAESDGKISGIIGAKKLSTEIVKFSDRSDKALEIISFFVVKNERGKGIGRSLIEAIEIEAVSKGHKAVIIWSGPKYKNTGWGFYDNLPDYKRVGFVETKEFPVWLRKLK